MTDKTNYFAQYLETLVEKGCTPLFRSTLLGREYIWFSSPTKHIFIEMVPDLEG